MHIFYSSQWSHKAATFCFHFRDENGVPSLLHLASHSLSTVPCHCLYAEKWSTVQQALQVPSLGPPDIWPSLAHRSLPKESSFHSAQTATDKWWAEWRGWQLGAALSRAVLRHPAARGNSTHLMWLPLCHCHLFSFPQWHFFRLPYK